MGSNQYWKSTVSSDDEYLDHIKRMERAPTMHPDVPLYPNVFSVFKNKLIYKGQKNNAAESQKKVQFTETAKNDKEKPKGFELHKWRTFKVSS
ncbi:hypothetical protein BC332_08908 [Capsicum chinense]|nr:hypothetical protein BC332_08908 [Capsicum chinense]